MKNLTLLLLTNLYFLNGCTAPEPSMTQELGTVSPAATENTESDSFMQKRLDTWLKNEWEPITSKTAENNQSDSSINNVSKKEGTETRFKLQDYVEKWKVYNREKENDANISYHNDKIEAMPVIGD